MTKFLRWTGAAALLFLAACKKDSPNAPATCTPQTVITPVASPSFASNVYPIFSSSCASSTCHDHVNPKAGLDLSSASLSYSNLVGVAAQDSSCTGTRVVAGDAASSVLYKRLNGSCGVRMPNNGTCLDLGQIQTIANWINLGAPNN